MAPSLLAGRLFVWVTVHHNTAGIIIRNWKPSSPKRPPGGVRVRTDGLVVMAYQQQREKSRVVKVDSEESWDLFIAQANNQSRPVFVHFGASWCVPSVAMNSYFEELAKIYQDVVFLLVDVDELKGVSSKMEVKAMPTFVLMRDGAVITKIIGANPEEMKKRVDAFVHLLGSTSTVK